MPLTFMKFPRTFESASRLPGNGVHVQGGYDPPSFISFFEKIEALEKKKPGLGQGVRVASADAGSRGRGTERNEDNSAGPDPNTSSIPRNSRT